MNCLLKRRWLIVFCLLLLQTVNGQQLTTRLYTVNDGLPTSSVYGAYEDHSGYLWIHTPNGLSRFDGRQFVNYDLSDGLPSLDAGVRLEDSRHRLWIATGKGMAQLIGKRFAVYPVSDGQEINYVFGIIETKTREIWSLTSKGVYQLEDSLWRKIYLYPGLENFHCRDIIETDSGLYVNYSDMIVFRNAEKKWQVIAEHPSPNSYFNRMYEHRGQIFVSARNAIFILRSNRFVPILDNLKGKSYLSHFFDSKDRLWYIFQDSDSSFHISTPGNWQQIRTLLPNHYEIISAMMEDSHGNIWVGTQEGLLKITEATFTTIIERREGEVKGGISAIHLPDSNLLLLMNERFYLYYFDKINHSYKLRFLKTAPGPIDTYTWDDTGKLWLVTRSGKLYRFNKEKLEDMSHLFHILFSSTFYCSTYDKKKERLFFCGDSTLLVGNDKGIGVFIPSNTGKPIPPRSNILTTKNGLVILHIPRKGIYLIDEKDNLLPLWQETEENLYGPLYEDAENNIWLVNRNSGLRQFRFSNYANLELINTISKKDGLQDNMIYSFTSDSMNRIWVTTPAGLDILKKEVEGKWKVYNYSKNTGLNLSNWDLAKLITDARGDVWLRTWNKLIKFDTWNIYLKNEIPKVIIENVQVNLRDVAWGSYTDSLNDYRQFPVNPKLKYADNTISIYFNGISFSTNPRLEYSYQLLPLSS
jgi:ligand-binding sensor domain-containing protein